MDTAKLKAAIDWVIDGARSAPLASQMMAQSCERLVAAGLPLWRVGVFIRTLHPEIFGRNFIWKEGGEVELGTVDFEIQETPEFRRSPLSLVFNQGLEIRGDPTGPDVERFPFLLDLRKEGATDYLALPLLFMNGAINAATWTTRQPGGFTDAQVGAIRSFMPALARYSEIVSLDRAASILLDTYVGNSAGARILGGQIRRGHTESMHAAIWLSDLRGFTALSDRLPPEIVVDILNRYFDCQVASIRAHGGEVLKFMGDGLLAVFPIPEAERETRDVCVRVVQAAREARANVDAMTYPVGEIMERFRFGVALHVGNILYGNIGGGNRLDFTCIGPAVNLAARLEKIAGRLNRAVVSSQAFAGVCAQDWTELGEFPIAGFAKSERVYGLADEVPVMAG
jgi:adenylate cyclase